MGQGHETSIESSPQLIIVLVKPSDEVFYSPGGRSYHIRRFALSRLKGCVGHSGYPDAVLVLPSQDLDP